MAVQRLQGGRPPVSHMASRQFTNPDYIPLLDKEKQVRTLNEGGYAWWNPKGWFQDDEEEMQQVTNSLPPPNSDESLLQFSST